MKPQSDIARFLEPIIIKDPPNEYEFMIDPPSISACELYVVLLFFRICNIFSFRDIVKLTAQFVARNGRQFLTSLMSKEARNPQFDFLKPAHGLFNYFTKLVEQYTKILIPSRELLGKLSMDIDNQQKVMDEVNYRVEWVKHQLRERAKEEEAVEKERGLLTKMFRFTFKIDIHFLLQLLIHKLIGMILLLWKRLIINHRNKAIFQ